MFERVWTCILVLHGVLCVGSDVVFVKKGDPVTLHNDIKVTKEDRIKWFFNRNRIAEIDLLNGKICTDVQCNEGNERFRGRLKLDHQTGSLTIMNTTSTDSGVFKLQIINSSGDSEKTFTLKVYVPVSVKKGDPVTLHNDIKVTKEDKINWYFNDSRIAHIDLLNGKNCTDVQCNEDAERFRGRIKLDHQTGSLTIMNTRTTDSGVYILEIIRNNTYDEKIFTVTVYDVSAGQHMNNNMGMEGESDTSDPDSGLSVCEKAATGVGVVVLLLIGGAVAFMFWYRKKEQYTGDKTQGTAQGSNKDKDTKGNVAEEQMEMLNHTKC